jgi:hypothetical protein
MTKGDDHDEEHSVVDCVNDSVVTDSKSVTGASTQWA